MRSLVFFLAGFGGTLKAHTDLNDSNWEKRTRRQRAYTTPGDNFCVKRMRKKCNWRGR